MPCPCCSDSLSRGMADSHPLRYCSRCCGILIDNRTFAELLRNRRAARSGAEPAEPRPIDPVQYERRIRCPGCRAFMETHPYYGPGNVVIDSCATCAMVWLDHGELATLETAGERAVSFRSAEVPSPDSGVGVDSSLFRAADRASGGPTFLDLLDLFL